MKGFFDSLKGDGGGNNKKGSGGNNNPSNLLSGLGLGGNKPKPFKGGGQSLGGSLPGQVIPVELVAAGLLGLKVEKRPNSQGTAIVAMVVAESQAAKAGLQRGDVLCFAGSQGQEEMMYDHFLELAKSDQRPLCFEVRRIPPPSKMKNAAAAAAASNGASTSNNSKKKSADSEARRQAVIGAAEARDKANRLKYKTATPAKRAVALARKESGGTGSGDTAAAGGGVVGSDEPMSDAARAAVEAAKHGEAVTAAQLGYNPYETSRATAGQARNATVATKHGEISHNNDDQQQFQQQQQLQQVRPPQDALVAAATDSDEGAEMDPRFELAFERLVTGNPDVVVKSSLPILHKLVVNATTKGATDDKFRRVRLANAKIRAAVVDADGGLDVMQACGFEMVTTEFNSETQDQEEEELVLVYPADRIANGPPEWLPRALQQMERYAKS